MKFVEFDAMKAKEAIVSWIEKWFMENGPACPAVIGISGGKDSTIAAALCVEALGKHRVFGVIMPNGYMVDENIAKEVCKYFDIRYTSFSIRNAYNYIINPINEYFDLNAFDPEYIKCSTNLPARLRMVTLYAVSQSMDGRVVNTCNRSEDYVGYSTRWGDDVGDLCPLRNFTVTEVKQIGHIMGIPDKFIEKVPSDGLCGKTDEDNLGFTYDILDRYIREHICEDQDIKAKIDQLHENNKFKMKMPESAPHPFLDWKGEYETEGYFVHKESN